ncbi:MAG: membrane protein insertion efficiency factor YidD [Marivibrio sp.]|uniref:membrane protein insertion efficiency factor YidD n=1 Tax=Marivibrio sp. TaxID=2039719 RepID=UPI0032F02075
MNWAQRLALGLIFLYRVTLSAVMGRQCRFLPTCSEYAADAIRSHGAAKGAGLALRRIARCHPWGGSGYDPVPPRER